MFDAKGFWVCDLGLAADRKLSQKLKEEREVELAGDVDGRHHAITSSSSFFSRKGQLYSCIVHFRTALSRSPRTLRGTSENGGDQWMCCDMPAWSVLVSLSA